MAPGLAEAAQVGGGRPRIGDVLEHLLADDDVEPPRLLQGRAEIELRIVEARVLGPRLGRVTVAADLGRAAPRRVERVQVTIDGGVQDQPLPVLGGRSRLRVEQPVADRRDRR